MNFKSLRTLDYLLSVGTLVWGGYSGSPWIIAGGCLGLVIAYINPAERVSALIKGKAVQRITRLENHSESASQAVELELLEPYSATKPSAQLRTSYSKSLKPYRQIQLRAFKHNQLSESSFNHANRECKTQWV